MPVMDGGSGSSFGSSRLQRTITSSESLVRSTTEPLKALICVTTGASLPSPICSHDSPRSPSRPTFGSWSLAYNEFVAPVTHSFCLKRRRYLTGPPIGCCPISSIGRGIETRIGTARTEPASSTRRGVDTMIKDALRGTAWRSRGPAGRHSVGRSLLPIWHSHSAIHRRICPN